MNTIKNYYFILGVSRGASAAEIEAAYESVKAVAAYDPVQASMMAEVDEAYARLSNPGARREFDDALGAPPQLTPPPGGNTHTRNFRPEDLGVSFEIAMREERRRRNFKKQVARDIVMGVIFLALAWAGINYGMKRFGPNQPPAASPAELFHMPKPQPASAPESALKPAVTIETVKPNQPAARSYSVPIVSVVTRDNAPCRPQPSLSSRVTAKLRKYTAVLATKEMRDKDGSVWYYVKNSQAEGWISAGDVKIYK